MCLIEGKKAAMTEEGKGERKLLGVKTLVKRTSSVAQASSGGDMKNVKDKIIRGPLDPSVVHQAQGRLDGMHNLYFAGSRHSSQKQTKIHM